MNIRWLLTLSLYSGILSITSGITSNSVNLKKINQSNNQMKFYKSMLPSYIHSKNRVYLYCQSNINWKKCVKNDTLYVKNYEHWIIFLDNDKPGLSK